MTIEELEIIIRANITDAVKGIKEVTDEVKKRISDSAVSMKLLTDMSKNYASQLKPMVKEAKSSMTEISKIVKQTTKEINSNSKIKMNGLNTSDIKSSMKNIGTELSGTFSDFDFLDLKGQLQVVAQEFETLIPTITKVKETIRETVGDSTSLLSKIVSSIKYVGVGFDYLKNTTKSKLLEIRTNFTNAFSNIKSMITPHIMPIVTTFKHTGKLASNALLESFFNAKEKLQEFANTPVGSKLSKAFSVAVGGVKRLISHFKSAGKSADDVKKKGMDFGGSFGKSISKGVSSIKKFALSLLSIRTAFAGISKAANAYLSFDTQLSNSIQNSWNVLGSLLAPMLEYVANMFAKLVSYISAFVKALTGIDLVARANAKALNKQAGAAKKASEVQLGLDEFHSVNKDSDSGGGDNSTISVGEIDTKKLDVLFSWIDKAKEMLSTLFDPIKEAWENKGQVFIDSLKNAFSGIKSLGASVFGSLFEVWTNGTGQQIIENLIQGWSTFFDIIGALGQAFSNAWDYAGSGTSILQSIADIFIVFQDFVLSIGDSLKNWIISQSFQDALNRIFKFTSDIFGIIKDIAKWFLEMYDKYVKPVIDDKLLPAISDIVTAIGDIWNVLKPVIDFAIEYIEAVLEPVIDGLCDFIGGIIDVIRGIAKFISGVFTGDWKKAWEGIKLIFKGVWDALSSIIKTPINMVIAGVEFLINKLIDGFNALKKALNKISFDIPDWVPVIGGKKWGFNFPLSEPISIPRLYTGGALKEDSIVRVADYSNARTNPEIIAPQSMMKETFKEAMEESNYNNRNIPRVEVDITGELRADGNDLVYVYDKTKNDRGYSGGKKTEFAY